MQFQIAITYSNFFSICSYFQNENIYRKYPRSFAWNYCKDQKLIEEDKYSKWSSLSKYSSVCKNIKIEKFIASIHVAV